ncbi:MAG: phage portal protein [bacterium JZ-2024 1]
MKMKLFQWLKRKNSKEADKIRVAHQDWWNAEDDASILSQAFLHFPWVFGAVSLIASNSARVPYTIEQKQQEDWKEVPEDHPAKLFFLNIHPLFSFSELLEHTVGHLCLSGNAYWKKDSAEIPTSVSLLPPHCIRPRIRNHLFYGWEYRENGRSEFIPPEEMVHFHLFSPFSLLMGTSPLKPLTSSLLLDHHILAYHREYFQKKAHSAGYFRTEKDLSEQAVKRLKAELETVYSGRQGFSRPMILFGGMTFHPLSVPPREMSFAELRQEVRRDILAIFRVPPILLGMDVANYATARIQKQAFWQETLLPLLSKIEHTIQFHIIRIFEEKLAQTLRFRFVVEKILLEEK